MSENYFDQFDQKPENTKSNFFDQFDEKKPQKDSDQGNLSRGFETAMRQVPQTIGGVIGLAGDAMGSDAVKNYGMNIYNNQSKKIQDISKDSDSFSNVLNGDASLGDWAAYGTGYVGGQALQALATGGVGAAVGKKIAEKGIAKAVEHEAGTLAAQEAAKQAVNKGVKYGAGTALGASNFVQEAGSIYPEALHQAEKDGRTLDGGDLARVAGAGAGAAALDTLVDASLLKGVLHGGSGASNIAKRAMRTVPVGMAKEGLTEGAQTGIERWGAQQDLSNDEAIRDYVDSAALGVLGGGLAGAGGAFQQKGKRELEQQQAQASQEQQRITEENQAQEQPTSESQIQYDNGLNFAATEVNQPEQNGAQQQPSYDNQINFEASTTNTPASDLWTVGGEQQVNTDHGNTIDFRHPALSSEIQTASVPDYVFPTQEQPPQKPSERLGLDPNNGPMSSAAALAVDSGASTATMNPQNQPSQDVSINSQNTDTTLEQPTSETARAIQHGMGEISRGMDEGAREQVAQYINEGKTDRLTYRKDDAIQAAISNPNYNTQQNEDGSVTVIGVKTADGNWHGVSSESATTQQSQTSTTKAVPTQQSSRNAEVQELTTATKPNFSSNHPVGTVSHAQDIANQALQQFQGDTASLEQSNESLTGKGAATDLIYYKNSPSFSNVEVVDAGDKSIVRLTNAKTGRVEDREYPQELSRFNDFLNGNQQEVENLSNISNKNNIDTISAQTAETQSTPLSSQITQLEQQLSETKPVPQRNPIKKQINELKSQLENQGRASWDVMSPEQRKAVVQQIETNMVAAKKNKLHMADWDDIGGQVKDKLVRVMEQQVSRANPSAQIDTSANEAATSPLNETPEPTQAQIEAGNYKKGHIKVQGLDISVENPKGSTRSGNRPDGTQWEHIMSDHYGYIKRTTGADNEHIDTYVGSNPDSDHVFIVDQLDQETGKFDEHKVMLGFNSREEATAAYQSNFDQGWKVGPIKSMSMDEFKGWLKDGDTSKPASKDVDTKNNGNTPKDYSRKELLKPDNERTGTSPLDTTFSALSVVSATRRILSVLQHLKIVTAQVDASVRGRIVVGGQGIGVNKVKGLNTHGFTVQVVDSFDGLPTAIQEDNRYQGENGETKRYDVLGVWHNGTLYINAGDIQGNSNTYQTTFEMYEELILHEVVGHYGVQQLFGKEYKTKLQQLFNALGELEGIRKIASQNGVDMQQFDNVYINPRMQAAKDGVYTESDVQQSLVGELFAFVAQNAQKKPFVRQKLKEVLGYIRQWFRDRGFDKFLSRYNDADVMMFLAEARKAVVDQQYFGKFKDQNIPKTNSSDTTGYSRNTVTEPPKTEANHQQNQEASKIADKNQTNPSEQQNLQVRSPSFKQWFGDWQNKPEGASQVVDAQGEPLVMYHGTNRSANNGEPFNVFDTYGSRYGLMGMGAYFTENQDVAQSYTKKEKGNTPKVYAVYLNIRKPLDMDAPADVEAWKKAFPDIENYHEGGTTNESWFRAAEDKLRDEFIPSHEGAELMQSKIMSMGFDGITHVGGGRLKKDSVQHRVFIVFDPEQIKSATENTGTFDSNNPDIRFSKQSNTGRSSSILRSYAGAQSKTGNKSELGNAIAMQKDGLDNESIRQQTGWFLGIDKKWRYEIDDSKAVLKGTGSVFDVVLKRLKAKQESNVQNANVVTVADILRHPTLFNAYPQIGDIEIQFLPNHVKSSGALIEHADGTSVIQLNKKLNAEDAKSTLLHEIQHAIQVVEGFALGGNSNSTSIQKIALDESKKIIEAEYGHLPSYQTAKEKGGLDAWVVNMAKATGLGVSPNQVYQRLAGEIEARDSQDRMNLSEDQRKNQKPYESQGIPHEDAIVMFEQDGVQSSDAKSNTQKDQAKHTVQQVRQKLIDKFGQEAIGALEKQGKLNILDSYDEPGVEGFYYNGKVTLIANALTENTIIPTFLHELGGHSGFQNMMKPEQYQELMKQFDRLVAQNNPIAMAAKALAEREQGSGRQQLEYLPYLLSLASNTQVKNAIHKGNVKRLIADVLAKVKAWVFGELGVNLNLTPDDMVALAERMVNKAAQSEIANKQNSDAQYSLNENSHAPFQKAIDDVVAGSTPRGYIKLGTTPDVLKMLGLPDTKVQIQGTTIEKVMGEHLGIGQGNHSHLHNLTPDTLRQIPKQLNNPIAVFKSGTDATKQGYVVLTELYEVDSVTGKKKPVIVALHMKPTKDGVEVINVASAYGRSKSQLQRALNDDLLYWNKEKGQQFLTTERLQLPWDFTSEHAALSHNIKTNEDLVKYQEQKLYSRQSMQDTINQLSQNLKQMSVKSIKDKTGYKWTDWLGVALSALGRRQLTEIYSKILPQLNTYNELAAQMDADKNDAGAEADTIVREWSKLKQEKDLAELMHDATLAKIDPAKPYQKGDDRAKYAQLSARYQSLDPDAQAMYVKARDAYKKHYANVHQAIKERILRSELTSQKKADLLKQMDDNFFNGYIKGVYFPLARFGKYVVVMRNQNGDVESVSRAETMGEAQSLRSALMQKYPLYKVDRVILDKAFNASRDGVGRGFMSSLFSEVGNLGLSTAEQAEFEDTLSQLYLSSMPDLSWAKHGIHRKGTAGFSQDARRAFAQNMFHGAGYLAKLRYGDRLAQQLDDMQKYASEQSKLDDRYDQPTAQRVIDEMNKRHDLLMNPKGHPLSSALTSLGFIYYLGLSPAAAMVNVSQTALVAYPIMGAKWGFNKAAAELLKASNDFRKGVEFHKVKWEGTKTDLYKTMSADISKFLNQDEKQAYDSAVASGVIDVTQAHDLAGIAQGEDSGIMWKTRPIMRAASVMFHNAERFNREVTFIASYRLARQAGETHDNAYNQAVDATYKGHFDYSSGNRPRVMQGDVAKVLLLFKQFGQNMLYTLVRQTYQSIKGETKSERIEARKSLGAILAMHATFAGALGLPMVGIMLSLASWAGGDDDDPWDAEVALRNYLAEAFGPTISNLLMKGAPRALTPIDLSGRVGINNMLLPDVQEGLEGKRWAESAMAGALGPVAGIGTNLIKGGQDIAEGQALRGVETILPVFLKNFAKTYRYADEGVQDKTGVSIMDEVSSMDLLVQGMGFSPSDVRTANEGKSAIYQLEKNLNERRGRLMTLWSRAKMMGDQGEMDAIWGDIQQFNDKNPSRRITRMNLNQSYRNRQKRIDGAEDGIYLSKKHQDARQAGYFAFGDN